jgi:hypothetical protein
MHIYIFIKKYLLVYRLETEVQNMRNNFASMESVDSLRKLLHDMQTSMITHSGKVLDVLLAKK